jgi:hypothetical protein
MRFLSTPYFFVFLKNQRAAASTSFTAAGAVATAASRYSTSAQTKPFST